MSLSSPIDVAFGELPESVADDEAARFCLVEWWSRVPDPRSLLGHWHRLEFVLGVAVCACTAAGHEPADAAGEWATGCDRSGWPARLVHPEDPVAECPDHRPCLEAVHAQAFNAVLYGYLAASWPDGAPKELPESTRPDVGFTAVAHPPHRRWCAPATLKTGSVGYLTDQLIRRGVHKSVRALEKDIRAWMDQWNTCSKPFVWAKTAEEILESHAKYRRRISGARH